MQKSPTKETIFCKETYDLKQPTNRSHPIAACVEFYGAKLKAKLLL